MCIRDRYMGEFFVTGMKKKGIEVVSMNVLTNAEAATLLQLKQRHFAKAFPECQIAPHLLDRQSKVLESISRHGVVEQPQLEELTTKLEAFPLKRSEKLQLVNVRPHSILDLFLCVEGLEERLSEQQITELLSIFEA
eukprot:TRINITY_DN934_c0_g2_i1.p2 TRINITY_DN934_c0_g2~~TRINITY_DN934_c0_g2_i1.p2  ORF type:complete len:137 (-),score=45.08 TRINITY_DN934_c0_g2_i1:655-1065(-)